MSASARARPACASTRSTTAARQGPKGSSEDVPPSPLEKRQRSTILATGFNWGSPDFVRYVVDVSGDRRGDVVGFGPDGVWVAQSMGNGGFTSARLALASLGSKDGWTPKMFPRLMADLTGDGRADIIAFGNNGVWTALAQPDGTFGAAALKIADFGADHGWTVQDHLRLAADLTGAGRADFVAFGNAGVSTALSDGAGG